MQDIDVKYKLQHGRDTGLHARRVIKQSNSTQPHRIENNYMEQAMLQVSRAVMKGAHLDAPPCEAA
jgi:hypothetical protein